MPSLTAVSTDATDPESQAFESRVHPRSLEEMRESQQRWLTRYYKPTSISRPNAEYVQRMNQTRVGKQLSFADVLERVHSRVALPVPPPVYPFSYMEVEQLFMTIAGDLCRQYNKPFVVDEHNAYALRNIIGYVAGDTAQTVLCLNRGLYLYGPTGVGKTMMMKMIRMLTEITPVHSNKLRIIPTAQLTDEVEQAKSSTALRPYFTGNICLDDLGEEPRSIPLYGQAYHVIHSLLAERDRRFVDSGLITHATSNLLPEELEARYGSRIADRCRQLFNFVQLGTDDTPSRR